MNCGESGCTDLFAPECYIAGLDGERVQTIGRYCPAHAQQHGFCRFCGGQIPGYRLSETGRCVICEHADFGGDWQALLVQLKEENHAPPPR